MMQTGQRSHRIGRSVENQLRPLRPASVGQRDGVHPAAGHVAGQFFHAADLAAKAGDLAGHRFSMTFPFVLFAASYFLGALCWLRVDVTETIPQESD